ncbi:MAG: glycoside hydrolase family 25 protein [Corynebacterium sp.]|uniref:glycoside hydrolase family 25 protein n=1 Tax=Corynebacterium sp. TaxID=1720 RepID=UPI0026DC264D|nr:glycoside hydrolase family 25 protein [Corynebacterium sp.]MDO5030335.1 glycoside hydrolase family 25 protein [Corynebacterium sp.]
MKTLPLSATAVLKRRLGRTGLAGIVAVAPLTLGVVAPASAQAQQSPSAYVSPFSGSNGSPALSTESPSITGAPIAPSTLNPSGQDSTESSESSESSESGSASGSESSSESTSAEPTESAEGTSSASSESAESSQRTGFYRGPDGVDVSKWQRPGGVALDWEKVAASGQKFAFIKATDGVEGDQKYFLEDSIAAAKAGLIVGSYHKAHPDRSAISQADQYVAALQARDQQVSSDKTLPPVLDIELENGLSTSQLQKWTKDFLERVESKTGETPMIYTYRWFWEHPMGNSTEFSNYPLWLAAYQDEAPTSLPGGWKTMTFWQRSSTGRVNGIPTQVDEDVFNGTEEELKTLAAAH